MRPTDWTQIEIRDETALAGSSASRLVNILAHVLPVKYVIVGRAEGAGPDFAKIFKSEGFAPFSLDEFIRNAEVVTQFDWADFYLVREHDQLAGLGQCRRIQISSHKRSRSSVPSTIPTSTYTSVMRRRPMP